MRCLPVPHLLILALLITCTGCASSAQRAATAITSTALPTGAPEGGESGPRWFAAGDGAARTRGAGRADARHLILFVGDGMGPSTVAAARILRGQLAGEPGEETQLSFERFPSLALAKTYTTDTQTPDSAGTMTAMVAGAKTRNGVIGLDQRVARRRCADIEPARLPSLAAMAREAGMATAVVTTTRITHATPAALFAQTPERDWESDTSLPAAARAAGCIDIAEQLLDALREDRFDVVLGGGRREFVDARLSASGRRSDGRDLLAEWRALRPAGHLPGDRASLLALPDDGAPVLGLFADDHMDYERDRVALGGRQPSLAEMTRFALQRLLSSGRPVFLVVEAGRIDHAHHNGWPALALADTLALDEAVAVAAELTSAEDTLTVVTADHGHTLTMVGYPARGNPILGLVKDADGRLRRGLDDLPYTTLSYANGPGAGVSRQTLAAADTTDPRFRPPALVPLKDQSHSGEDVAVYAHGPGSDAFRGVFEQHVIFHLLAQAQPALRAQVDRRLRADADSARAGVP